MPYVSVEGLVGAGKSTLMDLLKAKGYLIQQEGVDEWTKENRREGWPARAEDATYTSLIRLLYKDPVKWGFPFQMKAMFDRKMLREATAAVWGDAWGLTERCGMSENLVFARRLFDEKKMTHAEYGIYGDFYERMWGRDPPAGIIFLDSPPEICLQRVRTRGRPGEEAVTLDFLRRLETAYRNMLTAAAETIPTLTLHSAETVARDEEGNFRLLPEAEAKLIEFGKGLGADFGEVD